MEDGEKYYLGSACFVPAACEIYNNGQVVHLQPQVRSVLLCLVKHSPDIVERGTFFDEAWNAKLVSDESLTRCISVLRRILKNSNCPICIETVPKAGYRLKVIEDTTQSFAVKEKGSIQKQPVLVPVNFLFIITFFVFCFALAMLAFDQA